MMDAVLEQALVCDYNDQSMDALPNLWESNSFDSSMAVELREDDDYQAPIWPTGPLDFVEDDSDEDLSAAASESAMIVLHDRLITDMPSSAYHLMGSAAVIDCNNKSTADRSSLQQQQRSNNANPGHQSTYSITIGSRGEVEITEDPKPAPQQLTEIMSEYASLGDFIVKTEPASPVHCSSSNHQPTDSDGDAAAIILRESRKRTLPMPTQVRAIKVKPQSNGRLQLSSSSTTTIGTNSSSASSATTRSGGFMLPPTPPSSTSSDNEGSLSPVRDESLPLLSASSPESGTDEIDSSCTTRNTTTATTLRSSRTAGKALLSKSSNAASSSSSNSSSDPLSSGSGTTSIRHPINSPLISYQPKGSTGTLQLTEEEKRTLLSEGYPVPTRLPLTKAEEKSLKKIRRKIKNKISAQESRRKKKEYMDTLERRAQILADENSDYQQKLKQLEMDNAQLQSQLNRLQKLLMERHHQEPQAGALEGGESQLQPGDILDDSLSSI